MNILGMIFNIPIYVCRTIRHVFLSSLYQYERLSERNKHQVLELKSVLITIMDESDQKNLRVFIRTNRFSKIKTFQLHFYYKSKKVIVYIFENKYNLLYKGKVITFEKNDINALKNEFAKLNLPPR